jgi:23S rRNA pseudouridine1911/1915/1917 synthase
MIKSNETATDPTDIDESITSSSDIDESINFISTASDIRLDVYLTSQMSGYTRSHIHHMLEEGYVTVGGKSCKAGQKLKIGQIIEVVVPKPVLLNVEPQNIPICIVYEDEDIVIINKQKGLVVHPAAGNADGTLVNALLYHCQGKLSSINGIIRPGIVHRIDKDTSGLLVVAKNDASHIFLSEELKEHKISRIYEAVVVGNIKSDKGTIDAPVGRHEKDRKKMAVNPVHGRNAVTHYEVIERFKGYTHMRFQLETGRTHQIRVHMASMHHPIIGDEVYGNSCGFFDTQGQVLHARTLSLIHPSTRKRVTFEAELSDYFVKLLNILKSRHMC